MGGGGLYLLDRPCASASAVRPPVPPFPPAHGGRERGRPCVRLEDAPGLRRLRSPVDRPNRPRPPCSPLDPNALLEERTMTTRRLTRWWLVALGGLAFLATPAWADPTLPACPRTGGPVCYCQSSHPPGPAEDPGHHGLGPSDGFQPAGLSPPGSAVPAGLGRCSELTCSAARTGSCLRKSRSRSAIPSCGSGSLATTARPLMTAFGTPGCCRPARSSPTPLTRRGTSPTSASPTRRRAWSGWSTSFPSLRPLPWSASARSACSATAGDGGSKHGYPWMPPNDPPTRAPAQTTTRPSP